MKTLLISGSPRAGNTEFVLQQIHDQIKTDKQLILLRNKNIKHCQGCLACDVTNKCIQDDDMREIYKQLEQADLFVIATPNYFENVSGLLKNFIDRTNPFYGTDKLKDKKVIYIVTGQTKEKHCQKVFDNAFKIFTFTHKLDDIGHFCSQAEKINDLKNNPDSEKQIKKIVSLINDLEGKN